MHICELLLSGWKSDFTVIVGDRKFKLHKDILKMRSGYFSALFSFDENVIEDQFENGHVISAEIFELFVNHWYSTGKFPSLCVLEQKKFEENLKEINDFLLCSICDLPRVHYERIYQPKNKIFINVFEKLGWIPVYKNNIVHYLPEMNRKPHNMLGGKRKAVNNFITMINEHILEATGIDPAIKSFNCNRKTCFLNTFSVRINDKEDYSFSISELPTYDYLENVIEEYLKYNFSK